MQAEWRSEIEEEIETKRIKIQEARSKNLRILELKNRCQNTKVSVSGVVLKKSVYF